MNWWWTRRRRERSRWRSQLHGHRIPDGDTLLMPGQTRTWGDLLKEVR